MSKATRKILYLIVEGSPETQRPAVAADAEVLTLNEASAQEALEKIFAADAVSVWTDVKS